MSKARGESTTSTKLPRLVIGGWGQWMQSLIPHTKLIGGQALLTIVMGKDAAMVAAEEAKWSHDPTVRWRPTIPADLAQELAELQAPAVVPAIPGGLAVEPAAPNAADELVRAAQIAAVQDEIRVDLEDQVRNRVTDRKRLIDKAEQMLKWKTQLASDLLDSIVIDSTLWTKMGRITDMEELQMTTDPRALLTLMKSKAMRVDERDAGLDLEEKISDIDPSKMSRGAALKQLQDLLRDYGYVTDNPMNPSTVMMFWNRFFKVPANFTSFEEIASARKTMTNAEIMDSVNVRLDILDSDDVLSSNLDSTTRGKMAGTSHGPVAINAVGGAQERERYPVEQYPRKSPVDERNSPRSNRAPPQNTRFTPKPQYKDSGDHRKTSGTSARTPPARAGFAGVKASLPTPQAAKPGDGWAKADQRCWSKDDPEICIYFGTAHTQCKSNFATCNKCRKHHNPAKKCIYSAPRTPTKAYSMRGEIEDDHLDYTSVNNVTVRTAEIADDMRVSSLREFHWREDNVYFTPQAAAEMYSPFYLISDKSSGPAAVRYHAPVTNVTSPDTPLAAIPDQVAPSQPQNSSAKRVGTSTAMRAIRRRNCLTAKAKLAKVQERDARKAAKWGLGSPQSVQREKESDRKSVV